MSFEKVGGNQGISARAVQITKQGLAGQPARYLEIPITGQTAGVEKTTGVQIPLGTVVLPGTLVSVETAAGTIDVGILSSESGGDADGFLAAVSCAATGIKKGSLANGAETVGVLNKETSSAGPVAMPHVADGTAKTISYTASSASLKGTILIPIYDLPTA